MRTAVRLLALAGACVFFATSFRAGWNRSETDFPNYYTAAVLVRNGQPLHNYYEWTWFQRQMNYAGIENQLGGYIPQTPLTMLPLVPVTGLAVQHAKRVWLVFNLGFLAISIWLLSRVTRFRMAEIALLAFAGYGTLHSNFLLGQYYVFLLFLLVAAFYLFYKGRQLFGGIVFGAAFALKLYGGPFVLYFAVKRNWRAVAGMMAGSIGLGLVAIAIFGWGEVIYFGMHILPRALEGETLDPYNSGNGTLATLLRRSFVMEPELNPQPLLNVPWLFFFLRPLVTLAILIFPLLALHRSDHIKRDFAWFFLAVILASPNVALYTFILLLLPIALLLEDSSTPERTILIACYIVVTLPLPYAWSFLFPKVWVLMLLFLMVGRSYFHLIGPRIATVAGIVAILAAVVSAQFSLASYREQPGQRWQRIAVEPGAIYSSSPAVLRSGIVYESISKLHYDLRWLHDGRSDDFAFEGEAFDPVAKSEDGPIEFELVAHGKSTMMLFDPVTKKLVAEAGLPRRARASSAISPDKKWIAFTELRRGTTQIFLRPANGGEAIAVTGGNCNSFLPAWELDSKGIIFASDCGRGIGLTSLYRARFEVK
jgi:Glycosyltransferase family 87